MKLPEIAWGNPIAWTLRHLVNCTLVYFAWGNF